MSSSSRAGIGRSCPVCGSDDWYQHRGRASPRYRCAPCYLSKRAERRAAKAKADPKYYRKRNLKRKYDLTESEYDNLLQSQGGGCAICGKIPSNKHFPVDHNHQTGKIRGILCHNCNTVLGKAGDSLDALLKYVRYLELND